MTALADAAEYVAALAEASRSGAIHDQQQAARVVGASLFVLVLVALGAGLVRARKQIREHEADAAVEANFLELERALAEPEAARWSKLHGEEG